MRPRAAIRALFVVVIVATALSAGATSVGAKAATPQRGGTVSFAWIADVPTFNPITIGTLSTVGPLAYQVYDALVVEDNQTGEVKPHLLKSLAGSSDAMTWTMTLRPGVKFTDGTPFTSSAIKALFDLAADPANKSNALTLASEVATWDVSDPMVAKVTLKAPDAAFAHSLALRLPFVPSPTAMQKFGADYGTTPDKTVGAGPFVLSSWTRGSSISYSRNPSYWNAPQPYLDGVTVKVIADTAAAYNTVLTGGADWMATPNVQIKEQATAAGLPIKPYYYNTVSFRSTYMFNLQRAPFNDPLARQALQIAVDPKKLASAVGTPAADAIYDEDNFYFDKAGVLPKFDPKKAQELINQWSAKNGNQPLTFTIMAVAGQNTLGGNAEALQALLSGYQNLKVNVESVPVTAFTARGTSGNFDLFPNALGGSDPDIPLHAVLITGGGRNYGKYANPEMDAAINAGIATTNPQQRKKAYATVQKLMLQDLPQWIIPNQLFTANTMIVSNKSIANYDAGSWAGVLTDQIWLKTKK